MIRIAISVEGSTEVEFVKRVLAPSLVESNASITPISVDGNVSVQRLAKEMANLYWNFDAVTSLVDFYGFRRRGTESVTELEHDIRYNVESYIGEAVNRSNVIPYVQLHEFEALLFSDVEGFQAVMPGASSNSMEKLQEIRDGFETPEDIDDGVETAPSKRIAGVFPAYSKALHGPLVAENIGLAEMRNRCPRFNEWIVRLCGLGAAG